MSSPRTIRCGKCQVEMGVRHYVLLHRKGGEVPCPPVPCVVCRSPVASDGFTTFGDAVCSRRCKGIHPTRRTVLKAVKDVDDQLAAMRRAEKLPLIYERRLRAS